MNKRQLGNIHNIGDFLQIGRSSLNREIYYAFFVSHSGNCLLNPDRVFIQRWVMTRVVIQPLNHKFTLNYDRVCFSREGVCSYHSSIYLLSIFCQRLKHTLT